MNVLKLGRTGLRGLKKCPNCSKYNGTRAESCKNSECGAVFKVREPAIHACKISSTNVDSPLFSICVKERGAECWGFVEIENDNAKCYVEACVRSLASACDMDLLARLLNCQHVQAALLCYKEAECYLLKSSTVNSLNLSERVKEELCMLENSSDAPLIQRVSKTAMVVKLAKSNKYNLRFTHSVFYSMKFRDSIKYKFNCFCYNYKYNAKKFNRRYAIQFDETAKIDNPPDPIIKDNPSVQIKKKCIHFYACICAFASLPKLRDEFSIYIDPYLSETAEYVIPTLHNGNIKYLASEPSQFIEFSDIEPSQIVHDNFLTALNGQMIELTNENASLIEITQAEDNVASPLVCDISPLDMQITLADGDNLIDLPPMIDTGTNEYFDNPDAIDNLEIITINEDTRPEFGDWMINETFGEIEEIGDKPKNNRRKVVKKNKRIKVKSSPRKVRRKPLKAVSILRKKDGVERTDFEFTHWLSSVTESINECIHYNLKSDVESLAFIIPQHFFDRLCDRISQTPPKKRLPNEIETFKRDDKPPFGTFTKYIWLINNVIHLKQIFETETVPLELVQYFMTNLDGTYTKIEKPTHENPKQNHAITYLKIGIMSSNQMSAFPFRIEWIPEFLKKSQMGQLSLRFEFGRK